MPKLDLYISTDIEISKEDVSDLKIIRETQMTKVTNNLNYLQAQIEKTSIAEMREVFYSIIEEQMKNKMLAEASPEYALSLIHI